MIESNDDTSVDDLAFDTDLDDFESLGYEDLEFLDEEDDVEDDEFEEEDNTYERRRRTVTETTSVRKPTSQTAISTSETVKYVMDSILGDGRGADELYDEEAEGYDSPDQHADENKDRESRKRAEVLQLTMKKRLDQMSQQLEEWKTRHENVEKAIISSHLSPQPSRKYDATSTPKRSSPDKRSRMDDLYSGETAFNSARSLNEDKTLERVLRETQEEVEKLKAAISPGPRSINRSAAIAKRAQAKQKNVGIILRYREKLQSQEEEIQTLKKEISRIRDIQKRQKEKSARTIHELEAEMKELKDQYDKSVKDSSKKEKVLDERMNELSENYKTQVQKFKRQNEISIDLRQKLNSKIEEVKQLERAIKGLKTQEHESKEKEKTYSTMLKRNSELSAQNKDLKKQIEDLELEIADLQLEKGEVIKKMNESESIHKEKLHAVNSEKRELESKIVRLEETNLELQNRNNRESMRLSISQKEQVEKLHQDVIEWRQNYKELNDDLERIKKEQEIKLNAAEKVFNEKLGEVLEREKKFKDHNRTLQKKIEELLEKAAQNEQYLTDQIEWKTKYEQESSKWRVEKLTLSNERLDLEEQLITLKEERASIEGSLNEEVEKYKNLMHRERFLREALEQKNDELKNYLQDVEQSKTLSKATETIQQYESQIDDLRKTQSKIERNYGRLQQRLETYMHKYNNTLHKMKELKHVQKKLLDNLTRQKKPKKKQLFSDSDSDADSNESVRDDESEADTDDLSSMEKKKKKQSSTQAQPEEKMEHTQKQVDKDLKVYKNNLTTLIDDMKDHGQEISGLRRAFQLLKSKMSSPSDSKPLDNPTSTRTSMYNNYFDSSEDEKDLLSEEEDDKVHKKSKSSEAMGSRIKQHVKPPVPVQEKRPKKKKTVLASKPSVTQSVSSKKITSTTVPSVAAKKRKL